MLGVFATKNTIEYQRLLRIVVTEMNKYPIAFHMIQEEAQFRIVLFIGKLLFQNEAILVHHRKTRKRIPNHNGLAIHDFRALASTELKVMGTRRFFARETNAHLGMHDVWILKVLGLEKLKTKRAGSATLRIDRKVLESSHVNIDVKAKLDLDAIQGLDIGIVHRLARLDRSNIGLIVDAFKRNVVRRSMLPCDTERGFFECTRCQSFHETLGTNTKDLLVDFVIRHRSPMDARAGLDTALKPTLVGQRKICIVGFHTKAREFRGLGKRKADLLDGMRNGFHKLSEKRTICKNHLKEKGPIGIHALRACRRLLGHCIRIDFLVGNHNSLSALGRLFGMLRVGALFGIRHGHQKMESMQQ